MKIYSDKFEANNKPYPFLREDILSSRENTLYLYIRKSDVEDKYYAKFGEAKEESVWERYKKVTGSNDHNRVIRVWASDKSDKAIHQYLKEQSNNKHGFRWAGARSENEVNTEEAYVLETEDALEKLIGFINEKVGDEGVSRQNKDAYQDVLDLVDEICKSISPYYILDLCARWGKTRTILETARRWNKTHGLQVCVLTAYVKTVRKSYFDDVQKYTQYENCRFFDPDDYIGKERELESEMKSWLEDPAHYCVYYVALTGSEAGDNHCFSRRKKALSKFKDLKSMIVVEETDFGAHCEDQVKKFTQIDNLLTDCMARISTTGTNADRGLKIFKGVPLEQIKRIKRDYILNVLGSSCRPNAVKIKWHVLNNRGMVEDGIARPAEMENWSAMLSVGNDGHLREEMYVLQFMAWLFKPEVATYFNRDAMKLRKEIIDDKYATMIFTSAGNDTHKALKSLLEQLLDNSWRIIVLDGDAGMTNAEAEETVKNAFKGHHDNKVIVISSDMGNRSFSVPMIKNVVLMMDGGSYSSITQKTSRELTPIEGCATCGNVIDCRLGYASDNDNLATYLSQLGLDALDGELTADNANAVVEKIMATGKITFNEYFKNEQQPVRTLSGEDLRRIMQTRELRIAEAQCLLIKGFDKIREPRQCGFSRQEGDIVKMLVNTNIKGDGDKIIKAVKNGRAGNGKDNGKENTENPEFKKIQHLLFLYNNSEYFDSYTIRDENCNITLEEFKSMTPDRISAYENQFGLDMGTMADIVKVLAEGGKDPIKDAQSKW